MDRISKAHRSWLMSRVRAKDTKPEMIVRKLLHGMGYRYRLHSRDLPGKPDIVFASRRKAIFVHVCFWHWHNCKIGKLPKSNKAYWHPKMHRNRNRDKQVLLELERLGWEIATIWQCELDNMEKLSSRLIEFLGNSNLS